MFTIPPVLLVLSSLLDASSSPARLRELLHDSNRPRDQSQAALMLVRESSSVAEEIVRRGLSQTESPDVFLALASAVRLARDGRFSRELLGVLAMPLTGPRLALRQAAAETLAATADPALIGQISRRLKEEQLDTLERQSLIWVLGRSNLQEAAPLLLGLLEADKEISRRAAQDSLTELSGLHLGSERGSWKGWWEQVRKLSREDWLQQRLAHQASRSRRLEAELERSRSQLVRLHQQLYLRLPLAERIGHIQALSESEDATVRQLAVVFAADLLSAQGPGPREPVVQRTLAEVLLRLSHDSHLEVQRLAVLALGRVGSEASFDQLQKLLEQGRPVVRAAAARALSQQARGTDEASKKRRQQVVPLLQKALADPALEVVVEAAEDLGMLGVPEAGPVLLGLLRHSAEHVRLAAVHALERVADLAILGDLLTALGDTSVAIRFGLVGAIGRATGDGQALSEAQRERVVTKLQDLLLKDADPGVRSRSATVLGECGPASVLPALWQRVAAGEDSRVQEKAWAAVVEIIARSGSTDLLREWEDTLGKAGQASWRLRLLTDVHGRWQSRADARSRFLITAPLLASARLEQGKWQAALPLLRDLLSRLEDADQREQALRELLRAGEQALKAGDLVQVRRLVQEVRPHLPAGSKLAEDFDRLEKQAS